MARTEMTNGEDKKQIDWHAQDVEIERHGKRITLPIEPGPMPIPDAIDALQRRLEDEERIMRVYEQIDAFVLEALVALNIAMKETYGWASPQPTPGFFGPQPPRMLSVQTDVNEWVQVPFGEFKLPNVENNIGTTAQFDNGMMKLVIYGEVRKREQGVLLDLAERTRTVLRERSIYKGKPLTLKVDDDGDLNMDNPPEFIDVSGVVEGELVLNRDVEQQVETSVFTPIRHTDLVRKARIPLKRGVLLEGRFGVGKTLTALLTAKVCKDNGWTFIMVERSMALAQALSFAKRYEPSVVFCEDIDRAMHDRDESANDLLNTIDGVLSKRSEVMVVLTTNHVEQIEQAMLRPGRLDAVISVTPPDAEATDRLIRMYARGRLAEGETLDEVSAFLAGNIPASIREVVERSKLAMISHGHDKMQEADLMVAAKGMQAHLDLLAEKEDDPSPGDQLADALAKVIVGSQIDLNKLKTLANKGDIGNIKQMLNRGFGHLSGKGDEIKESVSGIDGTLKQTDKKIKTIGKKVDDIHESTV